MPFPAELKVHILKMIIGSNPQKCRSIVNACHSDKMNRSLCEENMDFLWELAGFDTNIQPKNMTTFTKQCNRDIHRVLKSAHDLLLSAQEYKVQLELPHENYYYYKFLSNLPSLNIQIFPNNIMSDSELINSAITIKTNMADIVTLCESDEWLASKFVLDEDFDEDPREEVDIQNLETLRNFVNSTSDFYLYDHAEALSSTFHGIQHIIDSLIRFMYGDGN